MQIRTITSVLFVSLALTACGDKSGAGNAAPVEASPAAANAAADASNVTSIPGYTPDATPAGGANAAQ